MRDEQASAGDFAERMLDADATDPQRLQRIRQELSDVSERKWSRGRRVLWLVGGVLLIVVAAGAGVAVLTDSRHEASLIKLVAAISTVVCVAMGAFMIRLGRTGVFHRQRHNSFFVLLAVLILGGLGLVFLNEGWAQADARMQFTGAFMLALLGFAMVLHFMEQHQLLLTRRLLELELRLAQIDEKLSRGDRR